MSFQFAQFIVPYQEGKAVGAFCQGNKEKHQRFAGALDPFLYVTFYH